MKASDLIRRVADYGGDMAGITDRFAGDNELYQNCFMELLNEPNFSALQQSIAFKEYDKAFRAAHALKGLSGNLGLTPLYDTLCTLVEALRVHDYTHAQEQYEAVERQFLGLHTLLADNVASEAESPEAESSETEPSKSAASAPEQADAAQLKTEPRKKAPLLRKPEKKRDRVILSAITGLVILMVVVILLFFILIRNYIISTEKESASHLIEISNQLKRYVEETIESDWNALYSISNGIMVSGLTDDKSLLTYLKLEQSVLNISDIILYVENGDNISIGGQVMSVDAASDMIARAREFGEYVSYVDSTITYTIPVTTDLCFHGVRVAAVSIVQDLETLLDNMRFSSFDGNAYLYLTQDNGIVISSLTHPSVESVFNILALLDQENIRPLSEDRTFDALLTSKQSEPFLWKKQNGTKQYLITVPVVSRQSKMRLFYIAPEKDVNRAMNSFSGYVLSLSVAVILVFFLLAILTFLSLLRLRKKAYDTAIIARERMLDLLVRNTKTAFGLFSTESKEPPYVSSNALSIAGAERLNIERVDGVYHIADDGMRENSVTRQLNERLRDWDGRSEFHSGYIQRDEQGKRFFDMQIFPVPEDPSQFVAIAQDVTEAYEREKATKDALALAESANASKSRFLSNMSHDIRTPMNAIINMTHFARENLSSPKKVNDYLQVVEESSDHLLRLVNDVLDMSRIESGQTVLLHEPFDLMAELKKLSDIVRPLCAERRQMFLTDFSGVHNTVLLGDQMKVSQILMNLLSNAVKFTPNKGAVRFVAEESPSMSENMVNMTFIVEDTGIGISQDNIERIFKPFARVEDQRVSRVEGTGLGLSICKSYVDSMGGKIRCESEEGEGSVFTVDLFFSKADYVPSARPGLLPSNAMPFIGKHCLLCEDNHTNQIIARQLLELIGFIVDVANNGVDGVKKFEKSSAGYYDIIYMDIQMPEMDGYQAAAAIRSSGHAQARTIPIVAMTANVFVEDIENARIAGMNGHLGKPLSTLELVDETRRALNIQSEKDETL